MTTQRCFLLALRTVAVPVALTLFGGNAAKAQFAQTPIDITSRITTLAPYSNGIEYHYQTATVLLRNTFGAKDELFNVIPKKLGTIKASVPDGSYVIVEGIRYNLVEFHFHQPSEHTLNGNRSPMEVHFVHLRADVQDSRTPGPGFTDCLQVDRPALAIGVFIAPGNADPELQKIFAPPVLPVDSSSLPVTVVNLNLRKLVPDGQASWRYLGGLSTPSKTCNSASLVFQLTYDIFPEIVRWYVLQDVVHLPITDMDKFHALFEDGNARPVQNLNGRPVFRDQKQNPK
jgi:carbonic anhydrase